MFTSWVLGWRALVQFQHTHTEVVIDIHLLGSLSSINKLGGLCVPDEAIEAYKAAANWSAAAVVKFIKPKSEMPA